jgi:ABC-2 type transport system ATP-binding protein
MSLTGQPKVIFLDEPTTGLDPEARIDVWQVVRDLAKQGTTVLLTTQYLDEAEQLADRIAILHEGRIIANGSLADLKQLLPPATVEYVEKQPTLEDVFLVLVGNDGTDESGNDESGKDQSCQHDDPCRARLLAPHGLNLPEGADRPGATQHQRTPSAKAERRAFCLALPG